MSRPTTGGRWIRSAKTGALTRQDDAETSTPPAQADAPAEKQPKTKASDTAINTAVANKEG